MGCATLHGRETAGRAALHWSFCQAPQGMSPSFTGGISAVGRFPHSRLSAQINSPYIAWDVFLGMFITDCWIYIIIYIILRSTWEKFNPAGLLKKYQHHCSFFILYSFKTEMPEIISHTINPPEINNQANVKVHILLLWPTFLIVSIVSCIDTEMPHSPISQGGPAIGKVL